MLHVRALVGHQEAASAHLWQDLLLLELYINVLLQYDTNEQMDVGFWLPTGKSVDEADDPIKMATSIVREKSWCAKRESGVVNMSRLLQDSKNRPDVDITDRLWSVLIRCGTYGMLVDCLNAFLTEVIIIIGS